MAAREIEYSKHLLPADPRAVVLESQLQLAVDNTADAVGILNEYLESSPTNVHVLQALFDLHCSRQMPHAARLPLQRAYNLQPTNLQILSLLIQLELEAENATALSHYLHALLQLDPKNAEAKEMLAQPMFVRDQIHQTDDTSTTGL